MARPDSTDLGDQPSFNRITPVRAYEGVVAQIEAAIFDGRLTPGQRLPSEREMMTQFAVSRATVREALRVLESNGLVRSRPGDPNGGAEVQRSSTKNLSKAMTSFARLGRMGVPELVQFRMVVEGSAVRLAAVLHDQAGLGAMQTAYEHMKEAVSGSYEDFSAADVAFHLSVARCSGNQLLTACSEVARDMVLGLIKDKLEASPDRGSLMGETVARHGEYLKAIKSRNGIKAEALARQDLMDYYGAYTDDEGRERMSALLATVRSARPRH
jgi:DNA-binding FadR family transcriptional regulator